MKTIEGQYTVYSGFFHHFPDSGCALPSVWTNFQSTGGLPLYRSLNAARRIPRRRAALGHLTTRRTLPTVHVTRASRSWDRSSIKPSRQPAAWGCFLAWLRFVGGGGIVFRLMSVIVCLLVARVVIVYPSVNQALFCLYWLSVDVRSTFNKCCVSVSAASVAHSNFPEIVSGCLFSTIIYFAESLSFLYQLPCLR